MHQALQTRGGGCSSFLNTAGKQAQSTSTRKAAMLKGYNKRAPLAHGDLLAATVEFRSDACWKRPLAGCAHSHGCPCRGHRRGPPRVHAPHPPLLPTPPVALARSMYRCPPRNVRWPPRVRRVRGGSTADCYSS